jgi:hypothetical protein
MNAAIFTGYDVAIPSTHPGGEKGCPELTVPHFFSFVEQRLCIKKKMIEAR